MDNDDIFSGSNNNNTGLSEHLLGGGDDHGAAERPMSWWFGAANDDDDEEQPLADAPMDPTSAAAVTLAGQAQPARIRDAWAAILFLAKQGVLLYLACQWGWPALQKPQQDDNDNTEPWLDRATLGFLIVTSILSLLAGVGLVGLLVRLAERWLQISLLGTVAAQVLLGMYLAWQMSWLGCVVCISLAAVTAVYARAVWRRIPLAAAHLRTACQAVQQNASVVLVAMIMVLFLALWMIVWILAVYGVYAHENHYHLPGWTVFLLILSLFWTMQVAANIVHVTVSGTVGTWWFCPEEADRFWSPAVRDSWMRSCTYSLGSICLGSLLAALMHVLHLLARQARRQQSNSHHPTASMLLCVLECLLRCTERMLNYFNKWYVRTCGRTCVTDCENDSPFYLFVVVVVVQPSTVSVLPLLPGPLSMWDYTATIT